MLEQGDDTSLCFCKEWVSFYKYTDLKQMPRIRWQKTRRLYLFIIAEPSVCRAAQHTHMWEIFSVQVRAMDAISCCENVSILSSLGSQLCSFIFKEGLRAWLKFRKELAVPVAGEAKCKQRKPSLVLDHPKKKKDIFYAFKFVFVYRFLGAMGIW